MGLLGQWALRVFFCAGIWPSGPESRAHAPPEYRRPLAAVETTPFDHHHRVGISTQPPCLGVLDRSQSSPTETRRTPISA